MNKIRKVTLIEPKPPGYHIYSRIALPRLGLPLLGAMLKQRGIEVSIYCQDFQEINYDDVLSSDLVGISTTTSTAPEGYHIADRVMSAGIPVVLGGSHVSFLADEALAHANYCVRGEGEHTLMELVDAIESGEGFENIKGLSYRDVSGVRHNIDRELVCDLDSLPFPDMSLIKGRENIKITPIATSRGCPYGCTFCSVIKMFGRGYRMRSIPSVIEEIKQSDAKQIFFYDDNFTANVARTKELLRELIRNNLTIPWTAQARVDVVRDRELLGLMKQTNCNLLYIGLESMNPKTLEEFHKNQSVDEIVEAVRILHEYGIMVHGMFVFGSENDSVADLRATADFALKNHIDTVQFMILTPLPGTDYYHSIVDDEKLLTKEWNLYDGQHVVYQPAKMSPYELQKETFRAMKHFYSPLESAKMLFGAESLKLLARVNYNVLRGRWHTAGRQLQSAALRVFYRTYGRMLIKRWEAANIGFAERINALANTTKRLTANK